MKMVMVVVGLSWRFIHCTAPKWPTTLKLHSIRTMLMSPVMVLWLVLLNSISRWWWGGCSHGGAHQAAESRAPRRPGS